MTVQFIVSFWPDTSLSGWTKLLQIPVATNNCQLKPWAHFQTIHRNNKITVTCYYTTWYKFLNLSYYCKILDMLAKYCKNCNCKMISNSTLGNKFKSSNFICDLFFFLMSWKVKSQVKKNEAIILVDWEIDRFFYTFIFSLQLNGTHPSPFLSCSI